MGDFMAEVGLAIARRPLTYLLAILSLGTGAAAFICVGALSEAIIGSIWGRLLSEPRAHRPLLDLEVRELHRTSPDDPLPPPLPEPDEIEREVERAMDREAGISSSYQLDTKIGRRAILGVSVEAASGVWLENPALSLGSVIRGRALGAADDEKGAAVCVVGRRLAEAGFGPGDAVGQTIRLGGHRFQIVGVVDAGRRERYGPLTALVPLSAAEERFRGQRAGGIRAVLASDDTQVASDLARAQSALGQALANRAEVHAYSYWLEVAKMRRMMAASRMRISLLASTLLVVGLLGMVSMLLANLSSRIHEIGLRRALGATRLRQAGEVLCEAVVTGVLGGCVGIAFGLLIVTLVSGLFESGLRVTPWWMAATLFASTGAALLAGLIPARAAMKVSPAESLRTV